MCSNGGDNPTAIRGSSATSKRTGVQTWARIMMCLFALVVIDALSAEADAAMYEAKRAGGNQFRVRVNPPLP